jgi:hypothetical protein
MSERLLPGAGVVRESIIPPPRGKRIEPIRRMNSTETQEILNESVEQAASPPSYVQLHDGGHNGAKGEKVMQFALLVYESPEAFAARNNDETDPYLGAWRAYHKALVEAGIYVGGNPLRAPETGTTVRLKEGKRHVQDGPFADAKEQLGGFAILELPSLDAALDWAARCPAASAGAVEVRPLAPEYLRRVTG